jgi:hypothetical protein
LKHVRPALLLFAVALFSAAAWADGVDPKVIPIKGSGSTPITITNPNPTVNAQAQAPSAANLFCLHSVACVDDVFQNQTGKTLASITMFFSASLNPGLVFSCGDMSQAVFFDNCNASNVSGGENIILSADGKNGFNGVAPATQQCVADSDPILGAIDKVLFALPGSCQKWDPDDYKFVGGEFGINIYGDLAVGQSVTTTAITTPEPAAGLMVFFGALAFALLKLFSRAA